MNLDTFQDPITEDEPCGPDLNHDMDPEYESYYFSALGRLPSFFVQPGVERPDQSKTPDRYFDSKTINFRQEAAAIKTLLERTRDLRLLTLMAQWEILTGRLAQMAETIAGIAQLLQTYPEDVHPNLDNGTSDRRDALEELNQSTTIIQPLMFMELCGSDEVTLRRIHVANGKGTPLDNESELNVTAMMSALSADTNRETVEKIYASLIKISQSIRSIESTCQNHATAPFTPDLNRLKTTITELIETLIAARPSLGQSGAPLAAGDGTMDEMGHDQMLIGTAGTNINISNIPRPTVVDHAHARQLLEACEGYFCVHEPSSGALPLITQARLLIGRPLVEALRTLLPQKATAALVDFGPKTGFQIDAERLYQLTQEATNAQQNRAQNSAQSQQALAAEQRQRQLEEEERQRLEAEQQLQAQASETDEPPADDEPPVDDMAQEPDAAPETPNDDAANDDAADDLEDDVAPEPSAEETPQASTHTDIAAQQQSAPIETPAHSPAVSQTYAEFHAISPETALVAAIAVEEYFRRKERSSPVPVLLQRARSYMNMDFESLIEELIPTPDDPPST